MIQLLTLKSMLEHEPNEEQITSFTDLERFVGRRVSIHIYSTGLGILIGVLENYEPDETGKKRFLVTAGSKGEQWIDEKSFTIQRPKLVE